MQHLVRVLAVTFIFAACLAGARADAGENRTFYSSPHRVAPWQGPACDAPAVTEKLIGRFNETQLEYWPVPLRMAAVVHAREVTTRQWEPTIIATRFCNATAYFDDGTRRELVYWLRSEQGFAGVGWGMQYCVRGVDQHMAYAPACRMLRPL